MTTSPFSPRHSRRPVRTGLVAVVASILLATPFALSAGATTTYTATAAPLPANGFAHPQASLLGVSCPAAEQCVAVGRYQSTSGPAGVIDTDVHGVWSTREITLPSDAASSPNTVLSAVSCVAVGNCVAVGQYDATTGYEGLIVTETAGVWGTGVRAPLPSGAVSSTVTALYGVDCLSTSYCVAVGQYKNAAGDQAWIVRKSGGVWGASQRAPLPKYAKSNFITQLDAVSCTSPGNCVAVGQFVDTSPARRAMIDTESGGAWSSSQVAPLPTDAERNPWAGLFGVKCFVGGNCVAVGVYQGPNGGQGLIDTESNGLWSSTRRAPLAAGKSLTSDSDQLIGLSCVSAAHCVAVGQDTEGLNDAPVAITSTGTQWSAVDEPRPANAISSPSYGVLNAVSCTSATTCVAVGQYESSEGQPALIESR